MPEVQALIDGEARSTDSEVKSPQTVDRVEVATRVYSIFEQKRQFRDQTHELFRDRTFRQWLDDNIKRFIQFKRRPAHKKDWQSNLASSTPNEKLIGLLSKLATQGMEARVITVSDLDEVSAMKELVFNACLKKAAIKNDDDFQIVLEMLEASEKGTVIGFEDWYHGKRKLREITDQDPETGELKFKEATVKEWNDVRSSLVNLEDFYPGDIYVRPGKIQDMDDCFLRTIMTEDQFDAEFGKYEDADKVRTVNSTIINESTPFWKQSEDVGNDLIEVLRYFNKKSDEYVIIANGIWINALGKSTVSPMPWNHKKLPFWGAVFEPLDANFFYGRSLIDKLIAFCDGKDALFDRIVDQVTLGVSKPVVTDGSVSSLTKSFLEPQNVIQVDWTNGRPNFDVVPIADPSPVAFSLYQAFQQNLESVSFSAQAIGGEGSRGKTATEASIEREGAMQIISNFLRFMECGIRDKNRLRFANILQFYSLPVNKKDGNNKFKQIVLRDEILSDGTTGNLSIKIVPKSSQVRVGEKAEKILGNNEVIEITPCFIRNFEDDGDIQIVSQSSVKMTEIQRQTLEINYQKVMAELYPDKFNRDYGFESMTRTFGKDLSQAKAKQPPQGAGQGMPGEEQMPGMPGAEQAMPGMEMGVPQGKTPDLSKTLGNLV